MTTLNASDLIGNLQIKVRFRHDMSVRLWLAAQIIRVASWVAGCAAEISAGDKAERI